MRRVGRPGICYGRDDTPNGRFLQQSQNPIQRGVHRIMIMTTTSSIQGQTITQYYGVVAGEAILGANMFRDLLAGIRDIVGGRSGAYEKELRKAREIAFEEIQQAAEDLGANAVVGIDIDYEVVGEKGGMLMVSVSGTAVRVG